MLGILAGIFAGTAPGRDVGALATALGQASHGFVDANDIRWQSSRGALVDALSGRWVVFLSGAEQGAARDVWRARVRVTPEGRALEIIEAHNLTDTPLGDDHALVVQEDHAAFATLAFGEEQSVTVLDLAGEGEQNKAEKLSDRVMSWLTNLQRTGRGAGVARFDVTLDKPADAVGLALQKGALTIDVADEGGRREARFDLAKGDLVSAPEGMHAQAAMHLPKRFSHWAVDSVRAVSWIGPEPIAWLEEKVFALRDSAKQLAFKATSGGDEMQAAAEAQAPVLDTSEASIDAAHWPPAKLTPIFKTPEAGEGEWVLPGVSFLKRVPNTDDAAPSAFYRTFVRPDEERPYAKCLLVAMDMRQLEVDMEAGTEDPQPLTGPHGPGKLPRDPAITTRIVAAFNGAFKTEHGHYGMMVKKRVLLPPQPGAATVLTTKDGRVGLGTWGANKTVTGVVGLPDEDIVSFRQNLDALVDRGNLNPSGRSLWGYSAPGKGIQTERSGICITTTGHMIYAWGDDVSATTLAKAMKMAGCEYGMHLDMNPYHTGFMFTNIEDVAKKKYKSELLSSGMEIPKERFIEWAPKDFFYVMVKDPAPPALDGGSAWKADGGTQPAPSWMPGLWSTDLSVSATRVELLEINSGRASFRVKAARAALAENDAKRVLFAVSMGGAEKKSRGDGHALLLASADGQLTIGKQPVDGSESTELPLLLEDGNTMTTPGGYEGPRAALGITDDGRVILARATASSDAPLADALKRAGCKRAVVLERGKGEPFFHRAGQKDAPRSRYDEAVLYAIATPMKPRGFRWEAKEPAPMPAKK